MQKSRTVFYANSNLSTNKFTYTGVEFREFVKYFHVKNLILLKSNYSGSRNIKGFDVVEGPEQLEELLKEDIYNYGDFCFLDYYDASKVEQITDMQVAELLYLAHMHVPLQTPFFEPLQNEFAYLAHDDGWLCKLYCRERTDFVRLIEGKTSSFVKSKSNRVLTPLEGDLANQILQLSERGILIDANDMLVNRKHVEFSIFTVGEYTNMDEVINNLSEIKSTASELRRLVHRQHKWSLI